MTKKLEINFYLYCVVRKNWVTTHLSLNSIFEWCHRMSMLKMIHKEEEPKSYRQSKNMSKKKYQSINLSKNDKINAFKRELQKLVRPFTIFVCTARNSDSMNNIKNFAMESWVRDKQSIKEHLERPLLNSVNYRAFLKQVVRRVRFMSQ